MRLSPPVYCNRSRAIPNFSSRNARNWIASTNVSSTIWTNYGKRSASKPPPDPVTQREQHSRRDSYNGRKIILASGCRVQIDVGLTDERIVDRQVHPCVGVF